MVALTLSQTSAVGLLRVSTKTSYVTVSPLSGSPPVQLRVGVWLTAIASCAGPGLAGVSGGVLRVVKCQTGPAVDAP